VDRRGSSVKTLLKAMGIVAVGLLAVGGAVILGSRCVYGPLGPFPGPELAGPLAEEPVEDWSFVDAVKVIQVETRPEDPYSVSTWLARAGDGTYVFAADDESPWVQNIQNDPRVRIRIEGLIYERRAVRVAGLETKHTFLSTMRSKYEHDTGFDPEFWQRAWDTGEFVLFRMEPR
jgi:hypothetical protein